MIINVYPVGELKHKKAPLLKEVLPFYPIIRREERGKEIVFKTLVRKRYEGVYYLIPMGVMGNNEAKLIHELHTKVYKYLMLGIHNSLDVRDDDQTNEVTRLKNL